MPRNATTTRNIKISLEGDIFGKIINAFSSWAEGKPMIAALTSQLNASTVKLQRALDAEIGEGAKFSFGRNWTMAVSQELLDLKSQVEQSVTVMSSAEQLIAGFTSRLDAISQAKDAEIRDQVVELSAELNAEKTKLAAAIEANTTPPAPPEPTPTP